MSKIVAIITEYNPFHNGHKYQIDKIREEIPNAIIISIMSGNIVQRGEFAFVDKYVRANMALSCGIDAVFELPFPYSCSTAEVFANAGVELAGRLGADYLYFGIENDGLNDLVNIAGILDSEEFEKKLTALISNKTMSYPAKRERALSQFGVKLSRYSNDMLAIEYIRAINKKGLSLEYRAINRVGSLYNDISICDIMSASGIRKHFYQNGEILSIPAKAKEIALKEINTGRVNDLDKTNSFILATALLSSQDSWKGLFDVPNDMGFFVSNCAKACENPNSFTTELSSKCYTNSRLKRALIYNVFNVTEIDKSPTFTILLGANEKGKKVTKMAQKKGFRIITKHKDSIILDEKDKKIYEKNLKVDQLFNALLKKPCSPSQAYKKSPIMV